MKLEDLARECIRVIQTQPGAEFIVLVGKLPAKGWPKGQLLGSDSRGRFYSYSAAKVLARLHRLGVVRSVEEHELKEGRVFGYQVRDEAFIHALTIQQVTPLTIAYRDFLRAGKPDRPAQPQAIETR